jgi:hypothetical protein
LGAPIHIGGHLHLAHGVFFYAIHVLMVNGKW